MVRFAEDMAEQSHTRYTAPHLPVHGRRRQRQPRSGRIRNCLEMRRHLERVVRRVPAHHQQPHGTPCRHHRAGIHPLDERRSPRGQRLFLRGKSHQRRLAGKMGTERLRKSQESGSMDAVPAALAGPPGHFPLGKGARRTPRKRALRRPGGRGGCGCGGTRRKPAGRYRL